MSRIKEYYIKMNISTYYPYKEIKHYRCFRKPPCDLPRWYLPSSPRDKSILIFLLAIPLLVCVCVFEIYIYLCKFIIRLFLFFIYILSVLFMYLAILLSIIFLKITYVDVCN